MGTVAQAFWTLEGAAIQLSCLLVTFQEKKKGKNHGSRLTTGAFISEVETVSVAVTFKALGDAVAATALEVTRVTGPQL